MKKFAAWFFQTNGEDLRPNNLTPTDIKLYRQQLTQKGAKPALINRHLAAIHSYGEWGVSSSATEFNPAKGVKIVEESPLAPHWLDKSEQLRLTQAVEKNILAARTDAARFLAIRDQAVVLTLMHTGLRLSELCALKLSDVELSERKGAIRVRIGKGSKARTIPANDTARKAIKA